MKVIVLGDIPGWEREVYKHYCGELPIANTFLDAATADYLARHGHRTKNVLAIVCERAHESHLVVWAALVVARYEPGKIKQMFGPLIRAEDEKTIEAVAALTMVEAKQAETMLRWATETVRTPIVAKCGRLALCMRGRTAAARPRKRKTQPGPARVMAFEYAGHTFRYLGSFEDWFADKIEQIRRGAAGER